MKSVLISIQPYYVFLIIARHMGWDIPQKKTIEVRKDFPKATAWNKRTHIYCSKNRKSFNRIPKQYQPLMARFLGKVIGEFLCDRIDKILPADCFWKEIGYDLDDKQLAETCLTREEIKSYGKGKTIYGWHISDLKIYGTPKELGEFNAPCKKRKSCESCTYSINEELPFAKYSIGCDRRIIRPPQSWCYVEEL